MVWAEKAERLKNELTDKYVVVMEGVPELKRFTGRTGVVKTVNMSGRALVQFDAPADISWYDIDPTYLTVIDSPLPKKRPPAAEAAPKPAAKPATKGAAGASPLELARQQGAAGAKTAAAKPSGKPSPLELARQQGAAKSAGSTPDPTPARSEPDKKLSPLELARQQGAAKPELDKGSQSDAGQSEVATPEPEAIKPATADTSGLSKLELARKQGPFKG